MKTTRTIKRRPTHPGGILKRNYIEPMSLTISEVAQDLGGSRKALSKIINEKSSITPEMALRLAKAFNTTPELWLNLQSKYNLWVAEQKSLGLEKIKDDARRLDSELKSNWWRKNRNRFLEKIK